MDNEDRADAAMTAVTAFGRTTNQIDDALTPEEMGAEFGAEVIGDLVADLRHLVDAIPGLTWDEIVDRSDMHYSAEVSGEG